MKRAGSPLRRVALVLLFAVPLPALSQTFGSHKVALTPKVKPVVAFSEEATAATMRRQYQKDFKNAQELEDFIRYIATYKKQIFQSSYIYTNLPDVRAYVKEVLKRVIPARLRDTAIKIYIVRDPAFNASVMGDGSVFVNIGLLASINSEAELAAVLGHEFGHFEARHSLKSYKTMKSYKADLQANSAGVYGLVSMYSRMAKLSRKYMENEMESDNYAIGLMRENGFAPASMNRNFELFQKIEKKYAAISGQSNSSYFQTHPSSEKRIKNVEKQFSADELNKGVQFFYDSTEFVGVRKRAIDESINLYFEAKNYTQCLEMAFRQHLFYPRDEYYLFFIVESLRRQMKLYKEFYKQNFITWRYKINTADVSGEGRPKHIETLDAYPEGEDYKKSVFYHLDDFVLGLTMDEMLQVRNKAMLRNDTLEFITNMDALQYFRKIMPPACAICNLVFKDNRTGYGQADASTLSDVEQKYLEMDKRKDSLAAEMKKLSKVYSLIFSIDSRSALGPYSSLNYSLEDKLREGYSDYLDKKALADSEIRKLDKLGFRDEYDLNNSCSLLAYLYEPDLINQVYQVELDFLSADPELVMVATNHEAKKIVFTDIQLQTDIQVGTDEEDNYMKCRYTVYCVDVANNKLRYMANRMYIKNDGSFNELYDAISKVYWTLAR